MTDLVPVTHRCTKCRERKPASEFSPDASSRSGVHSWCKSCMAEKTQEYQARKRAEVGDEVWKARQRETVARYRAKPEGRANTRLQNKARGVALSRLAEAHDAEYRALLRIARYELGLPV